MMTDADSKATNIQNKIYRNIYHTLIIYLLSSSFWNYNIACEVAYLERSTEFIVVLVESFESVQENSG